MKARQLPSLLLAALVATALATLGGCGDDDDEAGGSGNSTDAAFATDMTEHHQGAIDMAKIAQRRATHPQLGELADDIISSQEGEIATMRRIGDDLEGMGKDAGGHLGMSEHEMGMDMDLPALRRAKPFDRAFIDMMVPHHEGALAMARVELDKGEQPALRKLARDIIAGQSKEIARMRRWRKAWYGSSGSSKPGGHGAEQEHDGSMDDDGSMGH